MSIYEKVKSFLSPYYSKEEILSNNRPFVTLTYAQSLDGKLSGEGGKQLRLSCEESMIMTHRLRIYHDGIMVGIGTILNDDPRLTARLLEDGEEIKINQPQPIILDSKLRFPLSAKLLTSNECKSPWIFTSHSCDNDKRKVLEQTGAKVITINSDQNGQLSLMNLLSILHSPPFSIKRLMVEGGAGIIQSFLKSGLTDLLIITIAPLFAGPNTISATGNDKKLTKVRSNYKKSYPVKYKIRISLDKEKVFKIFYSSISSIIEPHVEFVHFLFNFHQFQNPFSGQVTHLLTR
ncbi:dihydrofolate reductase-like domain-containing protein [Glomus cerebriforme]|uniref:2,5-diamino-6-ribosylamino-4(3H)-pyrimidinone 5'-phosphate reductase n=1 Tax=Glomus cerebriforme TaxID=658196 RepID=A0A397ST50_9GLOM|nr:dihydrofolate reductase-like domain-containing protein [Glomus cerebriforme]